MGITQTQAGNMTQSELCKKIDQTLLKADTTPEEIQKICADAVLYKFAAVCVPPYYLEKASKWIEKSEVKLCTVIGFPLGYHHVAVKVEECKRAIEDGADELDAVVNIAAVKSGDWEYVSNELDRLVTMIRMKDRLLKIIFETALLTEDEILHLCDLCLQFNVDFAKTSTGFSTKGAEVETIRLMKSRLGNKVKIKASGGIRTYNDAIAMIEAGADRIGTSSGVVIIQGMQ